ncbi:hypothetical protein RND71_039904 [Anisodus tanguticus]|uniref:Small ribosomal subunit protein uS13m n=1 Tax=Anisodus tanguticus TaxID=243964 RepID=A0AAE1QY89_9SOLA|nr:hypothetical protein RND71_039904 [Anisodus tanguticus]
MDGIGPKKAIQVRYRLGISGNIKIKELTKYQIDQIEQMIGQDHVVHWELKRGERADIERLISISCYRGIRHQEVTRNSSASSVPSGKRKHESITILDIQAKQLHPNESHQVVLSNQYLRRSFCE